MLFDCSGMSDCFSGGSEFKRHVTLTRFNLLRDLQLCSSHIGERRYGDGVPYV